MTTFYGLVSKLAFPILSTGLIYAEWYKEKSNANRKIYIINVKRKCMACMHAFKEDWPTTALNKLFSRWDRQFLHIFTFCFPLAIRSITLKSFQHTASPNSNYILTNETEGKNKFRRRRRQKSKNVFLHEELHTIHRHLCILKCDWITFFRTLIILKWNAELNRTQPKIVNHFPLHCR